MATVQQNTLRGWKEIATYVGRDVRTVQRWEARRGFPVSRLPGGEGGTVYTLASEVDQWLHRSSRVEDFETAPARASGQVPVAPTALDAFDGRTLADVTPVPAAGVIENAHAGPWVTAGHRAGFSRLGLGVGAVAATLALAMLAFLHFHQESVQARGTPTRGVEAAHGKVLSADVDQLYLQGMYLFEKRTPESLLEARKALLDVTVHDPKNAPAWSGLAQVSTLIYEYGVERDAGAPSRAEAAAEKALAVDPSLAEPHAVLGFADFFWKANAKAAEAEFQSALRLDPSSAVARSWYGTVLTREARYTEALEQLNRAQMLQPSSTAILSNRALALGLSGHREMAVQLLEKAGGDSSIATVRFNLALLSMVRPFNAETFLHEELALAEMSHSGRLSRLFLAAQEAYRRGGETAMWRSMLSNPDSTAAGAELLAGAHAALGENDAALDLLVQAQRKSAMMDLPMNPLLAPLHRDPRFRQVLSAEGFPPMS